MGLWAQGFGKTEPKWQFIGKKWDVIFCTICGWCASMRIDAHPMRIGRCIRMANPSCHTWWWSRVLVGFLGCRTLHCSDTSSWGDTGWISTWTQRWGQLNRPCCWRIDFSRGSLCYCRIWRMSWTLKGVWILLCCIFPFLPPTVATHLISENPDKGSMNKKRACEIVRGNARQLIFSKVTQLQHLMSDWRHVLMSLVNNSLHSAQQDERTIVRNSKSVL